jgi:hypothetical protein
MCPRLPCIGCEGPCKEDGGRPFCDKRCIGGEGPWEEDGGRPFCDGPETGIKCDESKMQFLNNRFNTYKNE